MCFMWVFLLYNTVLSVLFCVNKDIIIRTTWRHRTIK